MSSTREAANESEQPQYILLEEWALSTLEEQPSLYTLRRYAREGLFHPPAVRIGKYYYVERDAALMGSLGPPRPAQQRPVQRPPANIYGVRTALYRHFDGEGVLLYVGISLGAIARLATHMAQSSWAQRIANVTIEWLPNREAAMLAEATAIVTESPLFNIAGKPAPVEPEIDEDAEMEKMERFLAASRREVIVQGIDK